MERKIGFNPAGKTAQVDPQHDISSLDPKLSRTNYFDGRLLKASDLTRDHNYLDERLREVGRAIGSGIVHGLEVKLDPRDRLLVSQGLAIAPSGRALELAGKTLAIDLHDSAAIASYNPDGPTRLARGLYAVTLQFAEIGTDSAEVYPRDLEGQRGFHFNAWSEGVEISLTPLRQALPNASSVQRSRIGTQHALAARAALVRELISNPGQPLDLPEDAVALGLLAIEHERPLWLDLGLLRRPHRHPHTRHALQQDLHRHYQELLNDVIQARIERGLFGEFPASHHFRVLPPYGNLPKGTINPETGRQAWFPSGYEVSIAPVREDDLGAILAESSALDPIDLEKDDDVDIMVLVPMSDHQFAWRARQLQHRESIEAVEPHTALPHLDRLALRLYDVADEKVDSSDAAIWRAIWSETDQPVYVRRPPRVAETLVSGVVLASGYQIPEGLAKLPPDAETIELQRDKLEEELLARERAIERHTAEIEELRERLELGADERLKAAEKQANELKDQLENVLVDKDELDLLRKQHALQLKEIEKLRDRIAALEAGGDAGNSEQLLKRIDELRGELADAEQQIDTLRKQLDQAGTGPTLPSIAQLVKLRGGNAEVQQAGAKLAELISDDRERLALVHQIAQLIDRRYDTLLFRTLLDVAKNKGLAKLRDLLSGGLANDSIGVIMHDVLPQLGAPPELAKAWLELEKSLAGADSDRVRELQDEVDKLRKQLDSTVGGDTTALEKEIKRLQTELAAAQTRIKELESGGAVSAPFTVDFRRVKVRPLPEVWDERLAPMRAHPELGEIKAAAEKVFELTKSDDLLRTRANHILAITPPKYDPALWRSLQTILKIDSGTTFRTYMVEVRKAEVDVGLAVAASSDQGLNAQQKAHWYLIDMPK